MTRSAARWTTARCLGKSVVAHHAAVQARRRTVSWPLPLPQRARRRLLMSSLRSAMDLPSSLCLRRAGVSPSPGACRDHTHVPEHQPAGHPVKTERGGTPLCSAPPWQSSSPPPELRRGCSHGWRASTAADGGRRRAGEDQAGAGSSRGERGSGCQQPPCSGGEGRCASGAGPLRQQASQISARRPSFRRGDPAVP